LASRDSAHPDLLEKLVARAIQLLGFHTEWLGGSGRTDVLASAAHGGGATIVLDAKSTGSGSVAEGQINFDTLKEHKTQHEAECIAVVGAEFTSERLAKRAQQHGVALVDIDQLEQIVRGHLEAPLPISEYAAFFRQAGVASLDALGKAWAAQRRTSRLLTAVLHRLNAEAESADPITQGALSSSELYLVLRSEMEAPPTPDELKEVLDFLAAGPMRCIKATRDRYSLTEDPSTTARRMHSYAVAALAATDQID
jgi:Restriction endonuclease